MYFIYIGNATKNIASVKISFKMGISRKLKKFLHKKLDKRNINFVEEF